jgi:hypothetical protein
MRIEIKRDYLEAETLGVLTVYDENNEVAFTCKTLELPWRDNQKRISCIPEDEYLVVKRKAHELRKYDHFHIKDVPNREWILIHIGNKVSHILGCILVGDKFAHLDDDGNLDVVNSTTTLKMLFAIMPDKFKLRIFSNEVNV